MIDFIIQINGRGGSGKSTLVNVLNEQLSLERTNNFTTRKPRYEWELWYTFVSEDEFHTRFKNNEIIECYFRKSNSAFYGIPAPSRTWIIQCEIMGLVALRKWCFQNNVKFLSIYLDVSRETLFERLKNRWDTNETPEGRLQEDEYYEIFKNCSDIVYDYNNKTVEQGIDDILIKMREAQLI
jgi:guanylate kinase